VPARSKAARGEDRADDRAFVTVLFWRPLCYGKDPVLNCRPFEGAVIHPVTREGGGQ
jgi:hypothetical protein